jgi:DNA-binding winged helix-turn-helix (wHTH) protein
MKSAHPRLVEFPIGFENALRASASTTPLSSSEAPGLARLHSASGLDGRRDVQRFDSTKQPTLKNGDNPATSEIQFGPFRLLRAQFLLLDGGKPVSIGGRALEILTVLVERPGELVSKEELMGRVWPNTFIEPSNLTVHVSALRRTLRDGRDGNRFIINIPGRGYKFVGSINVVKHGN